MYTGTPVHLLVDGLHHIISLYSGVTLFLCIPWPIIVDASISLLQYSSNMPYLIIHDNQAHLYNMKYTPCMRNEQWTYNIEIQ